MSSQIQHTHSKLTQNITVYVVQIVPKKKKLILSTHKSIQSNGNYATKKKKKCTKKHNSPSHKIAFPLKSNKNSIIDLSSSLIIQITLVNLEVPSEKLIPNQQCH